MSEKISAPYRLQELRQREDRTDWDRLARDFFKSQGKGCQIRMNAVLRAFMKVKTAG